MCELNLVRAGIREERSPLSEKERVPVTKGVNEAKRDPGGKSYILSLSVMGISYLHIPLAKHSWVPAAQRVLRVSLQSPQQTVHTGCGLGVGPKEE